MIREHLEKFWSRVDKRGPDECWLWTRGKDYDGYGRVRFGRFSRSVHRVSYEIHNGQIPAGLCVMHTCDVRACVNPAHLSLGTNVDNTIDRHRKGRDARGDRHGMARLTETEVRNILGLLSKGLSCREVSEAVSVNWNRVWSIKRGDSWGHLSSEAIQ